MEKQPLGNGWFAEIGQEYPIEAWAFCVFHDDENDPDYEAGWWSQRAWRRGFVSYEQATEALELFIRHEVLQHCEAYARGWDEKLEVVELVQVFYRFSTRQWSVRLSYAPQGVSGWTGYYFGEYNSAIDAIMAGQEQWESLRTLGTGGSRVDPKFAESDDYYGE